MIQEHLNSVTAAEWKEYSEWLVKCNSICTSSRTGYKIFWLVFQCGVVVLLMCSPCADQLLSLP